MPATKLIIGCGYLGRRIATHWAAQGDTVFALTRTPANAAGLRARNIEPIIGDVTQPATLSALPAAETVLYAVGFDRLSGKSLREVYVDGLRHALQALPARCGRFIYVSSTSVYGQQSGEWVNETSECAPASANGRVCLDAERVVREYRPAATVLRLAGIYGPSRLIARIGRLRAGMLLEGNPDAWLNLIHVDDAARAIWACEASTAKGATYVVCDNRPNLRCDFYRLLARRVGAPEPQFDAGTLDAAELSRLGKRCSNRRLRDALGIELAYPTIDEGLPAALQYDVC